ncbi:hypothetical protein SASPL_137172 [Salvia splendens]|uniref:BHLH domain-containing protein n=1 Tax=Salvia splendens TaxID=180675 RepID=A0A8X8ZCY5_SALSN|nr:hypothetical protein SASPL_137172 [Salvia splendens]
MEIAASFLDEEWESLSQIFSSGENLDFFATTSFDEGLFFNMHGNEDQHHHHTFESMTMNLHGNAGFMELPSHDFVRLEGENRANLETADSCGTKRMFEAADEVDDKSEGFPMENPLKKPRVSRNLSMKKSRTPTPKLGLVGVLQLTHKASMQRKRRERINERLKILQNLVPNGTKVDISTMLEEAVQYVKFLQLQIKLLSSDNMWMYAPLAYNGTDIGIYDQICPNLRL